MPKFRAHSQTPTTQFHDLPYQSQPQPCTFPTLLSPLFSLIECGYINSRWEVVTQVAQELRRPTKQLPLCNLTRWYSIARITDLDAHNYSFQRALALQGGVVGSILVVSDRVTGYRIHFVPGSHQDLFNGILQFCLRSWNMSWFRVKMGRKYETGCTGDTPTRRSELACVTIAAPLADTLQRTSTPHLARLLMIWRSRMASPRTTPSSTSVIVLGSSPAASQAAQRATCEIR